MNGVDLEDGVLVVERPPNVLDELAIDFSDVLDEYGVEHAYVAGYLSILTGRPRATDDIDVFIEVTSRSEIETLVSGLEEAGYWGPAMPLERMYENLSAGTNIWVAPDGQMAPHLEVKFPRDTFDRASLANAIEAQIGEATIPIGPLELQIAYKLSLGGQKDLEDAVHLHTLFEKTLRTSELERWSTQLEVFDRYERLTG